MIGADACESIYCAVFYERCRVTTRLEDNMLAMDALEANKGVKKVMDRFLQW
jgi:hypothetical protein